MNPRRLIVSLHDLHPASLQNISEQVDFCATLGISKFSILVVPHFHHETHLEQSPDTLSWLNQRHSVGDDLVLHGHYHDRQDRQSGSWFYTKFYTANEAEFLDLDNAAARTRLQQGLEIWKKMNWSCKGFIAPAWLMPESQNALLSELGFSYTTRLKCIDVFKTQTRTSTQSLCYSTRAAWRITASLLWNPYLWKKLLRNDVIRLSLHPNDLTFPRVREQIKRLIEMTLAAGYKPISYADYAAL